MAALTADEFESWLTPSAALLRVPPEIPEHQRIAWLTARLSDSLIAMAASRAIVRNGGEPQPWGLTIVEERIWRAPWRIVGNSWWETGDLKVTDTKDLISSSGSGLVMGYDLLKPPPPEPTARTITFYGIRIDPDGLPRPPPPAALKSGSAGRKPAAWWDDLWIEISRQIYVGDLTPDSQGAIETAMHDWLASKGHEAGETTVRDRARRLYRALQSEVGN